MMSKAQRVVNMSISATERTTQQQLSQSEASLNAIIDNAEMTVYSLDREFRYVHFNTYLKESLKHVYNIDIKVGDVIFDFLYNDSPEEADYWRTTYSRALNGEVLEFVKEFKTGNYPSYFKFCINPIKIGGKVTGLSCVAIDISLERIAEVKVRRNEARFRALIENSLDAIMVTDADHNIIYTSSSVARILGHDEDTFYILSVLDLNICDEDIPVMEEVYEKAMMFPEVPQPITLRVRHNLGHYIWISGLLTNMLNSKSVQGIVCNFRDVTSQKENELQQAKIADDLFKRNQHLEQYAYIIAHNLRAPVANLLGIANLLEMPAVSATDKEEAKSHILISARRLDDVIKDLNDILQAKADLNLHRESVGFKEIVNDVIASMKGVVEKSNAVIETDFSGHAWMITVRAYVHSVFHNLISNAIKYSKPGTNPLLKITSKRVDGRTCLKFEDNGLGFDLQMYGDNVFGLYKRFHPHIAEGKGMGLFMVKTQIENLGGEISIESEVGKGSVFTVLL
jgi:PAS domain S-box-containing protein